MVEFPVIAVLAGAAAGIAAAGPVVAATAALGCAGAAEPLPPLPLLLVVPIPLPPPGPAPATPGPGYRGPGGQPGPGQGPGLFACASFLTDVAITWLLSCSPAASSNKVFCSSCRPHDAPTRHSRSSVQATRRELVPPTALIDLQPFTNTVEMLKSVYWHLLKLELLFGQWNSASGILRHMPDIALLVYYRSESHPCQIEQTYIKDSVLILKCKKQDQLQCSRDKNFLVLSYYQHGLWGEDAFRTQTEKFPLRRAPDRSWRSGLILLKYPLLPVFSLQQSNSFDTRDRDDKR